MFRRRGFRLRLVLDPAMKNGSVGSIEFECTKRLPDLGEGRGYQHHAITVRLPPSAEPGARERADNELETAISALEARFPHLTRAPRDFINRRSSGIEARIQLDAILTWVYGRPATAGPGAPMRRRLDEMAWRY